MERVKHVERPPPPRSPPQFITYVIHLYSRSERMTRADPAQQIKRTQMDLAIQRWTPVCCFPAATSLHLKSTGKCKGRRWTEGWAHANERICQEFF